MTTNKESETLIAVVQFFRHGDRTAIIRYPKDPYGEEIYWPLEMGTLTNIGIQQVFDLGKFTRERYDNFLPRLFPVKNCTIYTTEKTRSVISAQAFAAGLYPPTKEITWNESIPWIPIPTYYEKYLFSSDLRSFAPSYTREFRKRMEELMEEFKKEPNAEFISVNSGVDFTDYILMVYLFDTLSIQHSMGLKLPDWTNEIQIPNYKYHLKCFRGFFKTDWMKKMYVGPQFQMMIEHFEKMTKDPNFGPKLIAFSGHDVNLLAILDTIGAPLSHIPASASSIFFELIKKNEEYYVKVFCREKEIEPVKINGEKFVCTLKEFKMFVKNYTLTKEQFIEEAKIY